MQNEGGDLKSIVLPLQTASLSSKPYRSLWNSDAGEILSWGMRSSFLSGRFHVQWALVPASEFFTLLRFMASSLFRRNCVTTSWSGVYTGLSHLLSSDQPKFTVVKPRPSPRQTLGLWESHGSLWASVFLGKNWGKDVSSHGGLPCTEDLWTTIKMVCFKELWPPWEKVPAYIWSVPVRWDPGDACANNKNVSTCCGEPPNERERKYHTSKTARGLFRF